MLQSARERVEASLSGLSELEQLRRRQEEMVRSVLLRGDSHETLLQDNIYLLRKQLNCLRRRDAGLMTQLQELDRQISGLRLDEETSHDPLETDSRPSSGFYELSDGASGSLSNSTNSVFSECFCSMADADGRLPSADDLARCLECDGLIGGLCDDTFSCGTVRRSLSLSASHAAPSYDIITASSSSSSSCDPQSKFHCDLVSRNGSEVYRYPSPLHAVAVQSPVLLLTLAHGKDEISQKATMDLPKTETSLLSAPVVPLSASWPSCSASSASQRNLSAKRLDGYIYGLLQRRALPIRTSQPRTSISSDPSKSVLRQASFSLRQGVSGASYGSLKPSELKPSRPLNGGAVESEAKSSPQRQSKCDQVLQNGGCVDAMQDCKINNNDLEQDLNISSISNGNVNVSSNDLNANTSANSLLKMSKKSKRLISTHTATLPKDFRDLDRTTEKDQEMLLKLAPSSTPKNKSRLLESEKVSSHSHSSSHSQDKLANELANELANAKSIRQNGKLRKGASKNTKNAKVKTSRVCESSEFTSEIKVEKSQHKSSSKKSRLVEEVGSSRVKVHKKSVRGVCVSTMHNKRLPASIPEGRVLDRHTHTLATSSVSVRSSSKRHHNSNLHLHHHHHHHSGRDQVVAKPKYKRNDYRHLRAIMELHPSDEAFKRAQRRRKNELPSPSHSTDVYLPKQREGEGEALTSPYAYIPRSDSEYSAECASLFHSTIADTSDDGRSNCTTNCFGDSESSCDEDYIEESTSTNSSAEESCGGVAKGPGNGRSHHQRQPMGAKRGTAEGKEEVTSSKAFVKIKASHNLKKKILRFRSGSLKLMTTV